MALRSIAFVVQLLLLTLSGSRWLILPVTASGWSYKEGQNGPEDWPGMCQAGTRQSPIDLDPETALAGYFEPLVILNYDRKVAANITNNGHTVMLTMEHPCEMVMAAGGLPGVYHLDQVHFHWKSEHTLRGKRLPLEMHMVHHNKKYSSLSEAAKHHQGVAVLGVLFHLSDDPNKQLTPLIEGMAKVSHSEGVVQKLNQRVELEDFLPHEVNRFYRYYGSLTTPNCDESVVWTVLTNLVPIGTDQVKEFYKIKTTHHEELQSNFRPLQKLDNRRIYLQHPHDLSYELTSLSSKVTLSWLLVLVCGLISFSS